MLLLLQAFYRPARAFPHHRHIQIEILPAGEEGPRNLDPTTIMAIEGIPFLSVTEFVRAKLRVWMW